MADATTPTVDTTPDARDLFKWSDYVYSGMAEGEDYDPANPDHFAAWIRMPNQFQADEIRDKVLAARARRLRILKDPESDAGASLAYDMEELLDNLSPSREEVIDEILFEHTWPDRVQAAGDVKEDGEDYEHIERDMDRLDEIKQLPLDERPADELASLEKHIGGYDEKTRTRFDELQQPRREALAGLDDEALVERVRDARARTESMRAADNAGQLWRIMAGTYALPEKGERPTKRMFASTEEVRDLPAIHLDALTLGFRDLSDAVQRGALGND